MSQEIEETSGWHLTDDDRLLLSQLHKALLRLVKPLAWSGGALIALGEACDAIEKLLEDEPVEVIVGLTIGVRTGDRDFEEGRFLCFRIDENEIRLSELDTAYSSDVGSDHSTRDIALLKTKGDFIECNVAAWLGELRSMCADEGVKLSVERDHV